jgi:predicted permease
MASFLQDLRYALRMLWKSPGFTAVAIVTLAVGVGLNTTLFTAVNAVALRPLPVRNGAQLHRLERWFQSGSLGDIQYAYSYMEFQHYRQNMKTFGDVMAVSWPMRRPLALPSEQKDHFREAKPAFTQLVSDNYFKELGAEMAVGRPLVADDYRPDAPPVVVLSYLYWQRALNGDAGIVGHSVRISGTPYTVVGVAGSRFVGTANPPIVPDLWAPLTEHTELMPAQNWAFEPNERAFQVLGHLAPGVSRKQVNTEATLLIQQFAAEHTEQNKTTAVTMQQATFIGNTEDPRFQGVVVLIMAIVGLVLLIACANLANMLLARASGRQREIGIRIAVGASRARLIQQLLTESVVLAMLGGSAGILLSLWSGEVVSLLMRQAFGSNVSFVVPMTPDARVFAYTLVVSVMTGVMFGLSPALRLSRTPEANSMKSGSESTAGTARSKLRGVLVGGQVAVSMLFLVSAGLFVRGLVRSWNADPGIETRTVYPVDLTFGVDVAKSRPAAEMEWRRLAEVPQVKNTALVERIPMLGTWTPPMVPLNTRATRGDLPDRTLANHVSSGYFATMGVPLLQGRNFSADEEARGAPVAIISEGAARKFWPGENPIGKQFRLDMTFRQNWQTFEVIGVARDAHTANLSRVDPSYVYLPSDRTKLEKYSVLVRIQGEKETALAAVRDVLAQADPTGGRSAEMVSLEQGPVRLQRLVSQLLSGSAALLASLALLLAAVGVYGVMGYLVSQREKEIGIRMALGARPAQVLALVLRQGMRPVAIGGGIGLVLALAVSIGIKATLNFPGAMDLLYGVGAFDPVTWMGIVAFLGTVALTACYVPARRVTRVDPMVALRYE